MKRYLFIICICIILTGCGWVTDKGIRDAYALCKDRGGVAIISPKTVTESGACDVKCKDGTIIMIRQN